MAQVAVGYRGVMPRTPRTSIPAPVFLLLAAALTLAGCSGGDDDAESSSASPTAEAKAANPEKSCQAIVGSGSLEDIQTIFDKYKDNTTPFTGGDMEKMRTALDALSKAGDNAAPKIRENAVALVADVQSLMDSRAKLGGVGKVAGVKKIQREIDALCA